MSKSSTTSAFGQTLGRATTTASTVLVTLKLAHVIDWPWWQVLSPTWGGFVVILVLLAIAGFVTAITD